jgi:hypothetical protein
MRGSGSGSNILPSSGGGEMRCQHRLKGGSAIFIARVRPLACVEVISVRRPKFPDTTAGLGSVYRIIAKCVAR